MNAVLREESEVPVLTNDAIEVHLHYLRSGLEAVQAAVPVLRDKIDALSDKMDEKIDALGARIDKTNDRIEAVNTSLSEKIDKLTDKVLLNQGQYKAMLWILSLSGIVAAAVSIAHTFKWI